MNPTSVVFFGISGAGKGTQCDLLQKYLNENDPSRVVLHPDMGALARTFMETDTSLAVKTREVLGSGSLMPSFIPIYLLTQAMNQQFTGHEHVIFDAVARRPAQSIAIDEMMRFWNRTNLNAIALTLTKETARARLHARGRYDDAQDEIINNRFSWYETNVVPAIDTLRELGWTIHTIDAEPDIETIHKNVLVALDLPLK